MKKLFRQLRCYPGIFIFILSCCIYSQVNWAVNSQIFGDLWLRIAAALLLGSFVFAGLMHAIVKIGQKRQLEISGLLKRLSLVLLPGVLLIPAPLNHSFYFLAAACCAGIFLVTVLCSKYGNTWLFPAAVGLVIGLTLFLRTWGIDYTADHPDGGKQISAAEIFIHGDYSHGLNDGNRFIRGYPFFSMHMLEWAYFAYEALYRHFAPLTSAPRDRSLPAFKAFLTIMQRWLNIFYQLLSVFFIYFIARKLFDKWVGVVSAGILAVSCVNIQMSHVVNADIPSFMFVLASMAAAVTLVDKETYWRYFLSGVFAGLAAAAKYHGLFSLLFVFLVFLDIRFKKRDFFAVPLQKIIIFLCVVSGTLVAFSAATPILFIDFEQAVDAMRSAGNLSHNARIPQQYVTRHLAYYFYLLPVHLNSFLRYFEPVPGWIVFLSLGFYLFRIRMKNSFLWLFPLFLFPFQGYIYPKSLSYHYLGILAPCYIIIGFSLVKMLLLIRKAWARYIVATALAGWMVFVSVSDASVFTVQSVRALRDNWFTVSPQPERFKIFKLRRILDKDYPVLFGFDTKKLFPSACARY